MVRRRKRKFGWVAIVSTIAVAIGVYALIRRHHTMQDQLPQGCNPDAPRGKLYVVTDIYPEHVVLDGNHPLAGIALRVHLTVRAIRQATEQEVGSGTAGTAFFKIPASSGDNLLH